MRWPFLLTRTSCQRHWPRAYTTYRQETEPPYRYCARARVLRIAGLGLVVGRWHSRASNETEALTTALGARTTPLLGNDGTLLPNFRKDASHRAP